ncbi:MAG TPA: hypothetical protein VHX37_11145 [Acidobacteriaceae bacterium]|nr:hypothetical protein [Acidobacteriaceae bacterium]
MRVFAGRRVGRAPNAGAPGDGTDGIARAMGMTPGLSYGAPGTGAGCNTPFALKVLF